MWLEISIDKIALSVVILVHYICYVFNIRDLWRQIKTIKRRNTFCINGTCEGNRLETGGVSLQKRFGDLFVVSMNKLWNIQSMCQW